MRLLLREEPVAADTGVTALSTRVISLTPRPMTVVFGFGMRLRARMRTKVEKMASQPTGSSLSVLWQLVKVVLKLRRSYGSGEILVEVWIVFMLQPWWVPKSFSRYFYWRKNKKNGLFRNSTLLCSSVFRKLLGKYISIADHRSPERGRLGV